MGDDGDQLFERVSPICTVGRQSDIGVLQDAMLDASWFVQVALERDASVLTRAMHDARAMDVCVISYVLLSIQKWTHSKMRRTQSAYYYPRHSGDQLIFCTITLQYSTGTVQNLLYDTHYSRKIKRYESSCVPP